MSALGSLVVKLALEYAQYTGGLDKSEQATMASLKRIQGAADQFSSKFSDSLKTGLGGLAAFFTAGALSAQVKAVVDDLDRISDAAAAIGLTTQSLAELGFAANQSGTDAQTLEGAMGKLNLKISEAVGGNKEAAKLFRELGVQLKDTNGQVRATDAVLADLSETFKLLPEGPTKSALAVELFGKSGAGLLQFLSQGADGISDLRAEFVALSGGSIQQAAEQAGAFNDQLDKLSVLGQAATIRFGSELLPTLTEVASMFTATGEDAIGLGAGMDIATLAGQGIRTLLEFVLLVGSDVAFVLNGIGTEIGGIAAQAAALATLDFTAVGNIRTAMVEDAENARKKLDEFQRRLVSVPQQGGVDPSDAAERRRQDEKRRTSRESEAASARARAALQTEDKAASSAADAYTKLLQSIRARMALADQQLALGRELTEGEKFEAKAKEDLAKLSATLSGARRTEALADIALTKQRIDQAEVEKQIAKELTALAQERQRARNAEMDGIAKWFQAQEEEVAQTLSSIRDRVQGLRDEGEAMALARRMNVSLAEAIELVAIARLQEKQAGFYEGSQGWTDIEREIAARKELLPLLSTKDLREREERGWSDMWNSIDSTAHDVWTNIWEGGDNVFKKLGQTLKASLLDLLYQLTIRPFIIQIGASIFGNGFASAAGMGGAGGGGGLMNLLSMGKNAYSMYGGLTSGQGFLGGIGKFIGLAPQSPYGIASVGSYATPSGTAMMNAPAAGSGGMGAIGAAGVFAAIALAIGNAFGVFKEDRKVGGGLRGTLGKGGSISPWEEWREGGTLFSGPSFSTMNPLEELEKAKKRVAELEAQEASGSLGNPQSLATQRAIVAKLEAEYGDLAEIAAKQSKAIEDAFDLMRTNVMDMAKVLGLSTEKLENFTTQLGGSDKGLNFDGLSADEVQAKIMEALATANNEMAQQLIGRWETTTTRVARSTVTQTGPEGEDRQLTYGTEYDDVTTTRYIASEFAREGEEAIDTLTRLATSLSTVNSIWENLGYTLLDASLAGGDLASKIADAFGGLEQMVAATSNYFQNFYSEEERRSAALNQLDKQLDDAGIATMPKTREEYRRLVEAQDLNTEAGRKAYAVLVMLSGVFAELTVTAEDAAEAARAEAKTKLDAAYSALERSIAAERKVLEAQRDVASELANLWGSIADIASSAMRDLRAEVASTAAMQAAQGMVYIEEALAGAQAGRIPDADGLSNALTAARGGLNPGNYASQFELDRDRLVLAGQMQQLAALAGKQKTTAELQLEALDRQIQQGEDTLDYWKQQIALATGTAETMLTVADAINAIRVLLTPAAAEGGGAGKPAGGASGGAVWGPGGSAAAKDSKYKKVVSLGSAGVGYQPVIDQATISKLDGLSSLYHSFDGTGDLRGLFDAIKGAGGTLEDLHLLSGYYEADWEKAAASVGVPAFARGGMHQGGWALVGEEGPELAYMPPARIYSASTTRGMQAGGNDAWASGMVEAVTTLATAVAGLSGEWEEVKGYLKTTARVLDDASEGPYLRMTPA